VKKKIAFQGRHGAYSECAAHYLFGEEIETLPMDSFEEIYRAIEAGKADGGAIPIENSTAGSIYENYDLLAKWRHPIVGEVKLQIEHCLCANRGASLQTLKRVMSHPQALAQCSKFFVENPQIEKVVFFDTAGSAEEVAKRKNLTDGGIASAFAARLYGLDILQTNLENIRGVNFTRFYGIQKEPEPVPQGENVKTVILFELSNDDRPGSLYGALGAFAKRGINMTRIESRPNPDKPWGYIFYASLIGNPKDKTVIEAFDELNHYTNFTYRLGSFAPGKTERLR
jgi:prephenate dehydratase